MIGDYPLAVQSPLWRADMKVSYRGRVMLRILFSGYADGVS